MDRQIRRLGAALLAMFLALFAQVNYLQVFAADELKNNPGNARRLIIAEYNVDRGDIRARDDKTILATSEPTSGDFKYQRTYPHGGLYAAITGFYMITGQRTALERSMNEYLSGDAEELIPTKFIDQIRGRDRRGAAVVTTIAPRLQQVAARELGERRGGVAAIDPQTGEIFALVSNPSYDPNALATLDQDAAVAAYDSLRPNDVDSPLHAAAADRLFPPGSTFKLVTAAAALENGIGPDVAFPNPPVLDIAQTDRDLRNFGDSHCLGGASEVTLFQALQVSCNVTFAQVGIEVGADALVSQAEAFGFNEDVPSRVPFAEGSAPLDEVDVSIPALAYSAIGQQSILANPLQMALIAGAIGNGGTMMEPNIVREVRAPSGRVLRRFGPSEYGRAMSGSNAQILTEMMKSVVASGTGTSAQIPGVEVAGKTGTAQLEEGANPHVWFTAFAPAADPQVAVAVIVLDGGEVGSEATGGAVAAPIARAVIEEALARGLGGGG
jgi:peptidoglycan glycosyltransferase